MINDQIACGTELTGLDIAKYLLSRLVTAREDIEKITKMLDCNYELASEVVEIFLDIGWITRNANRTYEITAKGKKSLID